MGLLRPPPQKDVDTWKAAGSDEWTDSCKAPVSQVHPRWALLDGLSCRQHCCAGHLRIR